MNENDPKGWKYEFGQLIFWAVVFGIVLATIIMTDEVILPLMEGANCVCEKQ